jgi:phosphoglycerate kinase
MGAFRTLAALGDLTGKRVVVRADLNVPIEGGAVADATRIERFVPTVNALLAQGAAVIVLSHFDRPKGKVVPAMSLRQIVPAVSAALGKPVIFVATDWKDGAALAAVKEARPGDVLLMENTRFHAGEEKNDAALTKTFASLGEVYVNDAFSAAHRAHASTAGIARVLPAAAGLSMQAEIDALTKALENPARPVMAIVGGAKISTKLDLLGNLTRKVDVLVVGGAMANTFLAAQGYEVGRSLVERDMLDTARATLAAARAGDCDIVLPIDVVVATEFKAHAENKVESIAAVDSLGMILDIGPRTVSALIERLAGVKTLLWNGPFGAFEIEPFDAGTRAVAEAVARLTRDGALVSVAGGGDTVAALNKAGVVDDFTYVSTAGGAFLEWLEGKTLPGVEALRLND